VETNGSLPAVGSKAPDFLLVKQDLSEATLASFAGKKIVLNIFPSIDTGVCATSVRKFNVEAAKLSGVAVVCVSKDLPFAAGRFCGAEGIENVVTASAFRDDSFEKAYGVGLAGSPLKGLLARSVVVIDASGKVVYTELVPEITSEPDYAKALAAL
jgi:thiol peroxidase